MELLIEPVLYLAYNKLKTICKEHKEIFHVSLYKKNSKYLVGLVHFTGQECRQPLFILITITKGGLGYYLQIIVGSNLELGFNSTCLPTMLQEGQLAKISIDLTGTIIELSNRIKDLVVIIFKQVVKAGV